MLKQLFEEYPELCVIGLLFIALFALGLKWYFQEGSDKPDTTELSAKNRYYPTIDNDVIQDIVSDENNFPM